MAWACSSLPWGTLTWHCCISLDSLWWPCVYVPDYQLSREGKMWAQSTDEVLAVIAPLEGGKVAWKEKTERKSPSGHSWGSIFDCPVHMEEMTRKKVGREIIRLVLISSIASAIVWLILIMSSVMEPSLFVQSVQWLFNGLRGITGVRKHWFSSQRLIHSWCHWYLI